VTGFASIKVFSAIQQIELLRQSPMLTLVALPATVIVQLLLERLTDICRTAHESGRHHTKDWFHRTWDETCQNAEDDIMGLTMSVIIVNSMRYAINQFYGHSCLPNAEQEEEGPECEFEHSVPEVLWLFGFGLIFVMLLFLTKFGFARTGAAVGKAEERRERSRTAMIDGNDDEVEELEDGHGSDETLQKQLIERIEDVILTTWGMAYAWCIFHGTRQLLVVINPLGLGTHENSSTLAVVLAFGVTYIAWILIRILDIVADLPDEWTPEEVDESIKEVIRGTSIFVGFAWEQTFDVSIGRLADSVQTQYSEYGPKTAAIAKLGISSICIAVVFCSWKWFILPYVFKKGWRYGQIFSKHDLHARCQELAETDNGFLQFLQHITHSMSQDETNRVDFAHTLLMNGSYRALPCSEVEAMRGEIEALKGQVRLLEQQLAEEKKAGEECRVHQRFLEWRLADERKPQLYIKTCCDYCGLELMQSQPVKEADPHKYPQDLRERHSEEERRAQERCSRVGEEGASDGFLIPKSRSTSASPRKPRSLNARPVFAGETQSQGYLSNGNSPEQHRGADQSSAASFSARISPTPSVSRLSPTPSVSRLSPAPSVSRLSPAPSASALSLYGPEEGNHKLVQDCGKIHQGIGKILSALEKLDR